VKATRSVVLARVSEALEDSALLAFRLRAIARRLGRAALRDDENDPAHGVRDGILTDSHAPMRG